jgi:predicted ATP-grasp superfamily ATP-dependent carboligase
MVAIVRAGTKALRTDDAKQLLETYDRVAHVNPLVVIQELIPGPDAALYYCCGYMDQKGRPLAAFVGQKLRCEPIHLGSASFVMSLHRQEIVDTSLRFLQAIGYRGLYGIEYKLDARDGRFKAIEFNARFGLWDILATRCGMDIPYIAYRDANDQEVERCPGYRAGVKWVAMELDIDAFRQYHREGSLSLLAWLRSLGGEKLWAVADWGDPRPFIDSTRILIGQKSQRLFRRAIVCPRRFAK